MRSIPHEDDLATWTRFQTSHDESKQCVIDHGAFINHDQTICRNLSIFSRLEFNFFSIEFFQILTWLQSQKLMESQYLL